LANKSRKTNNSKSFPTARMLCLSFDVPHFSLPLPFSLHIITAESYLLDFWTLFYIEGASYFLASASLVKKWKLARISTDMPACLFTEI
jgi:hypothetical protein